MRVTATPRIKAAWERQRKAADKAAGGRRIFVMKNRTRRERYVPHRDGVSRALNLCLLADAACCGVSAAAQHNIAHRHGREAIMTVVVLSVRSGWRTAGAGAERRKRHIITRITPLSGISSFSLSGKGGVGRKTLRRRSLTSDDAWHRWQNGWPAAALFLCSCAAPNRRGATSSASGRRDALSKWRRHSVCIALAHISSRIRRTSGALLKWA
jgi:hypothetical protein